ncbi:MAG: hypothetical protein EXQ85_02665 [Alphaproteobacteria bacterium]|nr:hypothetical protein [Alphaproteobacteria bacterium]
MKFHFDIDCTPEEARQFLGLPDVATLQQEVVDRLRAKLLANIEVMDPEALLKQWTPMGSAGWQHLMKTFWGQMGATKKEG